MGELRVGGRLGPPNGHPLLEMPTTSEPLTPTTPHSLDPSLSASTSYLAQEPLKLCSTCLQPLLGSGLDSEPDPFLLSLGDDPSASAIVDGSAPMMCGRCARSREDERRVGIRDELGTVGELGMGLGEQDRVGAVSALGGGDPQQTSQDINERAHGPAREGVLSSDSESEGTTAAVEAEGARAGRVDLTRDGSLLVPPPAGSSGLALRRQPSIDAVVQSAIVNAPAPPSTRSSSRSSLAPPPSSAAARPTTPLSPTPTRQTAPLPHPPTPSTSTYVLPPRRDPVLDLTKRRVPSVGKVRPQSHVSSTAAESHELTKLPPPSILPPLWVPSGLHLPRFQVYRHPEEWTQQLRCLYRDRGASKLPYPATARAPSLKRVA